MKRDMDLVRLILLFLEEDDNPHHLPGPIVIEGYSQYAIVEHLRLMESGGLLSDVEVLYSNVANCIAHITWDGHNYLDSVRDKSVWDKIKKHILDKGLSIGFEAIKIAAPQVIKSLL
jgi:hypothetical protein